MNSLRLIPLISVLLISCGRADTWSAPEVKVVASPDGSALLRVSPGMQDSHASAVVLRYDPQSGGYQKAAEFLLRNPIAPYVVVITNEGKYIVTFDDWAEIGRTENVVVVYRGTGEYLKSWALKDIFTDEERKKEVHFKCFFDLVARRSQSHGKSCPESHCVHTTGHSDGTFR